MQNSFQKKLLIGSVLFLLVSVGIFFFLYFKITHTDNVSKNASRDWQLAVEKREKLNSLDSMVRKIEGEKAALQTHFAKSSDIVPFLDTMDTIGTLAHVTSNVSSVNILPDKKGLVAEIKASGNFSALYTFLVLLENAPYELEFSSMNLRREDTASVANTNLGWSVDFQVKLLSFMP